jgi:hypothetical protein
MAEKSGNLKPTRSTLIMAIKMRANISGDRAALARAEIKADMRCRSGRVQKETLGHILGQCIYTKKEHRSTTQQEIIFYSKWWRRIRRQ